MPAREQKEINLINILVCKVKISGFKTITFLSFTEAKELIN